MEISNRLLNVSCLYDDKIWTNGNDRIIRPYNLKGEFPKKIQTSSVELEESLFVTKSNSALKMKRDYRRCIILVYILRQIQPSEARYCQDAVDSAEYVVSCPSSKIELDTAAQKKNCSRIALHQNCSTVERFQYHCVIDVYRSKMVEVCAPSRIIFGHCAEFNFLGGVIQDQFAFPCNNRYPKCADFYESTAAYKYSDCYDLNSKYSSTADATTNIYVFTTTPATDKSILLLLTAVIVLAVTCFLTISLLVIAIRRVLRKNGSKYNTLEKPLEERNTNLHVIYFDTEAETIATQSEGDMDRQSDNDKVFDTQEQKKNAPEKIYSRDQAFELNQEDENIDDDDNNNYDINALQTDQMRLENL